MSKFHNIARALIIENGSVLLVKAKGARNTFLLGGHIEFGERAEDCVKREIMEEIGMKSDVRGFIGAVEHRWPADTLENHEICLIFSTKIADLDVGVNPKSKEDHLELFWAPISELSQHNLQPYPLAKLISGEIKTSSYWASTLNA